MNYICKAKDKDSNKWYTGYYVKHQLIERCPIVFSDEFGNVKGPEIEHYLIFDGMADWNLPKQLYKVVINEKTLCRALGIYDMNGKELFEGDIIDIHQTVNGQNKFIICVDDIGITAKYFNTGKEYQYNLRELLDIDLPITDKTIEIIGNIHDI